MNSTTAADAPAPHDIEGVVLAAARAVPPSGGDLGRVRIRARARRRRRIVAQSAIAAVLVAVVAVGVPTVGRLWTNASGSSPAATPSPTPSPSLSPSPSVPVVRLAPGRILLGVRERPYPTSEGLPVVVAVNADGTVAQVPKPRGFSPSTQQEATPDGRIVMVGRRDSSLTLAVLGADGAVLLTRPLTAGQDGSVTLSAASDTEAFLNRDTVFVAHNLVTGEERELRRMGGSIPNVIVAHASHDLVVVAPGDLGETSCAAALLDQTTGQQRRLFTAPLAACTPFDLRLSADGRYLAMRVPLPPDRKQTRLFVFDTTSGALVHNSAVPPAKGAGVGFVFSGWGWSGPSTLRLAGGTLPSTDLTRLAEVLQISTIAIP